jgi:tRNA U34 2-thiouridine synthase MnmA/TrmU
VNWVSMAEPDRALRALVKIRHKHESAPATVEALPNFRARITFDHPQRAVTPGQAAVFYSPEFDVNAEPALGAVSDPGGPSPMTAAGSVVLGGGWIR